DLELAENLATQAVVRDHAADGALDEELGTAGTNLGHAFALLATDVAGVAGVDLLIFLRPGDADFGGIHDDDVVPTIDVRGEERLPFAAKQVGSSDGDITEDLAIGVDDVP